MNWQERAEAAIKKNRGGGSLTKPTKPSYVSSVSSPPRPFPAKHDSSEYTAADLAEMDRLIGELAQLEGWSDEQLAAKVWESHHMAPCNVQKALRALRIAVSEALAPWPSPPAKHAQVTLCELVSAPKELCVIQGGKR